MRLAGERCTLRTFVEDDVACLPDAIGLFEVVRYMSHRIPHPYSLEDARAWVLAEGARDPADNFVIDAGGAFAGGIGIAPLDGEYAGVAEIGYWLVPAFRGRGLAADATRTLARHAFAARGLRRLSAWVMEPNRASIAVLERSGFTLEGRLRRHLATRDGRICDGFQFGRLATDPEPKAERPPTSAV